MKGDEIGRKVTISAIPGVKVSSTSALGRVWNVLLWALGRFGMSRWGVLRWENQTTGSLTDGDR